MGRTCRLLPSTGSIAEAAQLRPVQHRVLCSFEQEGSDSVCIFLLKCMQAGMICALIYT